MDNSIVMQTVISHLVTGGRRALVTPRPGARIGLVVLVFLAVAALTPAPALAVVGEVTRLPGEGQAGQISDIDVLAYGDQRVVTAVRDGGGNLKLITWSVGAGGVIRLNESLQQAAGAATLINLGNVTSEMVVTAVRDGGGNLKLITWRIGRNDTVTRLKDSGSLAGAVSEIALRPLGNGLWVTAVRDGGGNLKLITWSINIFDGSISRLPSLPNSGQAGAATNITVVSLPGSRVVTAVRDGGGNLKLITWRIDANGAITRLPDSPQRAEAVTLITLRRVSNTSEIFVTAVRDGGGNLKLITWRIGNTGAVTRLKDSANKAGAVSDIAISETFPGLFVTAVRDGGGNLKLIVWGIGVV